MAGWQTCIRFRPRTTQSAYIHIIKGNGCSSSVGRTGSKQTVRWVADRNIGIYSYTLFSLGNGCVYTGIVMHELMHASG